MSEAVEATGHRPGFTPGVALHTSGSEPRAQLHALYFCLVTWAHGNEPACLILPETGSGLIFCGAGS